MDENGQKKKKKKKKWTKMGKKMDENGRKKKKGIYATVS